MIRLANHSASPLTTVFQTAAMSSSNSTMTTFSTRCSKSAVRLMIPPPANGSTRMPGRACIPAIQRRKVGTNHVFPPGYRKGLRCWTEATLTGFGVSVSADISAKSGICLILDCRTLIRSGYLLRTTMLSRCSGINVCLRGSLISQLQWHVKILLTAISDQLEFKIGRRMESQPRRLPGEVRDAIRRRHDSVRAVGSASSAGRGGAWHNVAGLPFARPGWASSCRWSKTGRLSLFPNDGPRGGALSPPAAVGGGRGRA